MFTNFEEYAATQMLGQPDSPPRSSGKLYFSEDWQRTLFGMAMALSKAGHFEWEDFRQNLIATIAEWERDACGSQTTWDYYERYALALLKVLEQYGILSAQELQSLREQGLSH
ncbi:nitrile hydratase accessory protein [Herbaspirillum huttiense]|uniref:nitrile hydratase accessory protein n=1 Tax=Herbaspirillum huttiense TaxID=863372 RepID=UPI0039AF5F7E